MYKLTNEQLEQLSHFLNLIKVEGQQSVINLASVIKILGNLEATDENI